MRDACNINFTPFEDRPSIFTVIVTHLQFHRFTISSVDSTLQSSQTKTSITRSSQLGTIRTAQRSCQAFNYKVIFYVINQNLISSYCFNCTARLFRNPPSNRFGRSHPKIYSKLVSFGSYEMAGLILLCLKICTEQPNARRTLKLSKGKLSTLETPNYTRLVGLLEEDRI